jgi:hypothetical protein
MSKTRLALLRGHDAAPVAAVGDRVELHPATDAWMSGDRFGTVEEVSRVGSLYVRMDRSGRTRHVAPFNIGRVLAKEVSDEMLAAFSFGGLRAIR